MTEQTTGVVSAEVDQANQRIVRKGILGAETSGASSQRIFTSWTLKGATGRERFIDGSAKTIGERLNEAYRDDDLEPEDREFLELSREHFSRLDDE
jgi:hypothetical protein